MSKEGFVIRRYKMKYKVKGDINQFMSRMIYLAWQKSGVFGMGMLQDRGEQPEQVVVEAAISRRDYPGGALNRPGVIDCDYVFGRMMKLRFTYEGDVIECRGGTSWTPDYQSFCTTYRDFPALVKATAESLGCEVVEV